MIRLSTLVPLVLLGACATVSTDRQVRDSRSNVQPTTQGMSYHLPQGLLRLTVTDADGAISVLLAGPVMVADPNYRMLSSIRRGTISDDDVTIAADPKTNLLNSVAVTSEGRLDDILESAVRTVVALQGSSTESGRVIFEGLYRVDQLELAMAEANAALRGHFAAMCPSATPYVMEPETPRPAAQRPAAPQVGGGAPAPGAGRADGDSANASETPEHRRCRELETARARAGNPIAIAMDQIPPVLRSGENVDLAPCGRGVCYRPLVPARVSLTFGPTRQTQPMLFPDETQVIAVNLQSGVFAQQKYDLKFTDGVLTSYTQNSRSELLGLVSLPLTIVKAVISAPGQLLGARQAAAASEQTYLAAIVSLAQQRAALRTACAAQPQDCPETALRIIRATTATPSPTGSSGFER